MRGVKTKLLSFLAAVAAFLTFVGGLDLAGIVGFLPDTVATGFATALPLLAGIVHLIKALGDFIDDGKINQSWSVKLYPVALWLTLGVLSWPLVSCAAITSGVTGQPIATAPVKREGGRPFNVATSDVLRAESQPETAWGLYDAGAVAEVLTPIADSGK